MNWRQSKPTKRRIEMKRNLLKLACVLCVAGECLSAGAQRQPGQAIRQLVQDVQAATPHATLNDDQKAKLQGDIDGVNATFQARQQGQSIDRDKLMATIDDMHQIVDSGAFKEDDKKKLDKEFNSVSPH
jgi:hypothetical protein